MCIFRGFIYTYEDICNFYLCLKTKPFLILAGISGTGKSKLVKLFSEAINANNDNNRYRIISVKPDWTDSTELFGYKNISDSFIPGPLTLILDEASRPENVNKPYFICLDEMNLARVEHYLSEYLSIIESRGFKDNGRIETDKIFPEGYLPTGHKYYNLRIPENLYIIGTVNMDDTTFAFSRKVLDRVNTIEFSEVRLEELDFTEENIEPLELDNSILKTRFLSLKDALSFDREYVRKINSKIIELNNILSVSNHHFPTSWQDYLKSLDKESYRQAFDILRKILLEEDMDYADKVLKETLKHKSISPEAVEITYKRFKEDHTL
ncbi:MAG: AAA domain-containing protein, partial [Tissierellia bacterium]|nr:AAA domain-containing protein [Tissierellia bacterium]